jgi:prepilin-type processing-associated H-X9-DG protein
MTPRRSPARRGPGFTLIEILVIISIVGVLASLLLPAIQQCREAARRSACINNLGQIAVALQQYQNVHDVLPPGVVNATGPILNLPRGYHHGWMLQILPFMDEGPVARCFDDAIDLYAPEHGTARSPVIASFLCPSDGGVILSSDRVAQGNYAGCHNDLETPIGANDHGVFFLNSRVGYEDVPDGSATTIFVGEKLRFGQDLGWASGTRATLRNTGFRPNSPDVLYGTKPIMPWDDDDPDSTEPPARPFDPDPTNPGLVGGFSSRHNGGANFAFGDSSVRFIREGIDPRILRGLANRADGNLHEAY